jgi:hypothetical protein
MRVGYVRVSTVDLNTVRQLDGVAVDRVFTDTASGKDANSPRLLQDKGHYPALTDHWSCRTSRSSAGMASTSAPVVPGPRYRRVLCRLAFHRSTGL